METSSSHERRLKYNPALLYLIFQVLYDVRGILEKNRDTFRDDILFILKDSRYLTLPLHTHTWVLHFICKFSILFSNCFCRLDFIYDLFERVGSRSGDETLKMGTARRKPTVSSQFRVRLKLLSDKYHSLLNTRGCMIVSPLRQ